MFCSFMCLSNSFLLHQWEDFIAPVIFTIINVLLEISHPHTLDLQDRHTQKKKIFLDKTHKLHKRSQKARWGDCFWERGQIRRMPAEVSGQVVSLNSLLNQQPPQLFPQLPPIDAHWPLSAATPQRENWSRHRSAKHRVNRVKIVFICRRAQKNK